MIDKSFGFLLIALVAGLVLAVIFNVIYPELELSPSIMLFIALVSVVISWGILRLKKKSSD